MGLENSYKRRTKNRLYRCVICRKEYHKKNPRSSRIYCSLECTKEGYRRKKMLYGRTEKAKMASYVIMSKRLIKKKTDEKLLFKYRELIIKLSLFEDEMKKRGITL